MIIFTLKNWAFVPFFYKSSTKINFSKLTILLFILPLNIYSQQFSLSECISMAIDTNLNVQKNYYNKQLQEIDKKISARDFLPSLNAGIYNNFTFGVDQDIFGVTKRNDNFNNNASLNAQVILYNGGKIKNSFRRENFEEESSYLTIEASKRDISVEVLNRYLQILLNKEILALANNSVQKATLILQKIEKSVNLGFSSSKILLEAKANLYKERQRELEASTNVKRALLDLTNLLQIKKTESFDIQDISESIEIENTYPKPLDLIINEAIISSPKIQSLEIKLKSLEIQTEISKSSLIPTVSLNTNVGTYYFNSLVSDRENNFFNQYKLNLYQQIRLGINIPIFNKGVNKFQIEKNRINEDIGKNAINNEKQVLISVIKKIYFEMNSSYENYLFSKEVENNIKKSLDLTEKSYAEGYSTLYEFKTDYNSWIEAVTNTKKYKYGFLFNTVFLDIYSKKVNNSDIDIFLTGSNH